MLALKVGLYQGVIVADPDRIAAALRYQQELDAAQRPATMNQNIAAQGAAGRSFMAPPESVMDERYPAWKKSQNDAETLMMATDLVGSAIPLAGPAVKGAAALGRFAGPELARGLENYMVRSGGILPMDTWHGSPHRFPPTAKNPLGEFDPTKIGTGEGAQAYGHGLYLAENPGVAVEYQRKLAAGMKPNVVDANLQKLYDQTGDWGTAVDQHLRSVYNTPKVKAQMREAMLRNGPPLNTEGGSLYKVDLPDEQIAKMLDWDKPLSQQSELIQKVFPHFSTPEAKVLKLEKRQLRQEANDLFSAGKLDEAKLMMNRALAKEARMFGAMGRDEITGQELHMKIQSLLGEPAKEIGSGAYDFGSKATSEMLREMGIPGIRYLDQGSRAAGAGTSNFVVFDPKHMNIIGRE